MGLTKIQEKEHTWEILIKMLVFHARVSSSNVDMKSELAAVDAPSHLQNFAFNPS